jgi:arylformamidase
MTLIDWDDAYANSAYIPNGMDYPSRWAAQAAAFRAKADAVLHQPYDTAAATKFDLFLPASAPQGVVIFVHGGYWKAFSPALWSHLAAGPVAAGWAVAMPGYTLAPNADLPCMGRQIAKAVSLIAKQVDGPIHLAGHSAGGHLVARMACTPALLPATIQTRIGRITSISGLHDLRPLMMTQMNATLGLTETSAAQESPALLPHLPDIPVTAWVGADERPEFLRQARLLYDAWAPQGCAIDLVIDQSRHHFDVINGLEHPDSPLTKAVLRAA